MWLYILFVFVSTAHLDLSLSSPPQESAWCRPLAQKDECWGACIDRHDGAEKSCNPSDGLGATKEEYVYNVLDVAERENHYPIQTDCAAGQKRVKCTNKITQRDCEKYVSSKHPFCIYNAESSDGAAHVAMMIYGLGDTSVDEQPLSNRAKLVVERTSIGGKQKKTVTKMQRMRTGIIKKNEGQWSQWSYNEAQWSKWLKKKVSPIKKKTRTAYQVMNELNDKHEGIHMKVTLVQNKKEIPLFDAVFAGDQFIKPGAMPAAAHVYTNFGGYDSEYEYDDDDDDDMGDDSAFTLLLNRLMSKAYKRGYMTGKLHSDYF